jgi:hypothetical protein
MTICQLACAGVTQAGDAPASTGVGPDTRRGRRWTSAEDAMHRRDIQVWMYGSFALNARSRHHEPARVKLVATRRPELCHIHGGARAF